MPISDWNKRRCSNAGPRPVARSTGPARPAGFTLIEMMAVLVLTALLAGIVVPSFQRWFEGLESRSEASTVTVQLQRLFSRTTLLGLDWTLDATTLPVALPDGKVALKLPAGWRWPPDSKLQLSGSGMCRSGELPLISSRGLVVFTVESTSCAIGVRYPVPA